MEKKRLSILLSILLSLLLIFTACASTSEESYDINSSDEYTEIEDTSTNEDVEEASDAEEVNQNDVEQKSNQKLKVPKYSGSPYSVINDNEPNFSKKDKNCTEAFEEYSSLDELGRCGVAYANICRKIMPTEKRGNISSVHPTGWHSYMGWERCHLIGFQLAGENANENNLITGTRYMNVSGMLPFENMVADYVEETGNHVLYRVTPDFHKKNLVAHGVQMEAWSVEDDGEGICFNVYCYNVNKSSKINYATGVTDKVQSSNKDSDASNKMHNEAGEEKKGTVYWTPGGSVYHSTSSCPTLSRSKTILSGSVSESGKNRCCERCCR